MGLYCQNQIYENLSDISQFNASEALLHSAIFFGKLHHMETDEWMRGLIGFKLTSAILKTINTKGLAESNDKAAPYGDY